MHDLHPLIKCVCSLLCFFPGQWLLFLVLHACTLLGWNISFLEKKDINRDIIMGEISYFFAAIISIFVALSDVRISKNFVGLWSLSLLEIIYIVICVGGLFLFMQIMKMTMKKNNKLLDLGSQNKKTSHSKIFTCYIAPISEEIIFRAVLLMTIADYVGNGFAIVLSALLFSLMHLKPKLMLKIFCVGLFLGMVTIVTGTIIIAIAIHILLNYSSSKRMVYE